ncbi:TerC family protein [Rudanella paleaurantiibacter]|uniref:TerC family protein n=1 Tax=Rudanella paleaurantiibacter TaxID=2614655 RepID=A0A7J5U0W2_9BACT|nr:TerC family protein [Rudanella paleaurantiibacter]KAB7731181.1 TerC family protein [Rudanella paleaurantiibacter]
MELVDSIVPLLTLIVLEVILGIDNIIFISILSDKLPPEQRDKLRLWGIGLAMFMRLGLLALISWIMRLDQTLFTVFGIDFSGKGLILLAGGLFLIYKSTKEIYHKAELNDDANAPSNTAKATFRDMLIQILILDMVFSIDSIITAVGMVDQLWVMYTAVIVTVGIMLVASKPISNFISQHPSFKILALCFLLIIGMSLVAEGLHFEIPKGYIYFSMAFAFLVDLIQMKTVPKPTANTVNEPPKSVNL